MKAFITRKAYGAIIFDCDGTLTDSMPVHYIAWRSTLACYGINFPETRFYELAGVPTDRIIERLCYEQSIEVNAQAVAAEKEAAFLELTHLLQPIDVVRDVAQYFRGRLPLAVASGGVRDVIVRQLHCIGCADWFDAIVTAEDTQRHKPFPDVFLEAARRLGVEPAKCLVYEDAELGLQAARAAGMDAIDVRDHFQSNTSLSAETQ